MQLLMKSLQSWTEVPPQGGDERSRLTVHHNIQSWLSAAVYLTHCLQTSRSTNELLSQTVFRFSFSVPDLLQARERLSLARTLLVVSEAEPFMNAVRSELVFLSVVSRQFSGSIFLLSNYEFRDTANINHSI